jgi:hypothetical protein
MMMMNTDQYQWWATIESESFLDAQVADQNTPKTIVHDGWVANN